MNLFEHVQPLLTQETPNSDASIVVAVYNDVGIRRAVGYIVDEYLLWTLWH